MKTACILIAVLVALEVTTSTAAATVQRTAREVENGTQGWNGTTSIPPGTTSTPPNTTSTPPPGTTSTPWPPSACCGATYICWGRDDCPTTEGTELVYSGLAGGSRHSESGGGSNYLCLKNITETENLTGHHKSTERAYVYGAEYEVFDTTDTMAFPNRHNKDVPCALCYTSARGTAIMIPGTTDCPDWWTTEYSGYLMAGRHNQTHSPKFECVDANPETLPFSSGNNDASLFYFTEARCDGICPPYEDGEDLTCVVCTR